MITTFIVKVFKGDMLTITMCFDDYDDALKAQELFTSIGNTVVLISEESEDLSFDDDGYDNASSM